MTILSIETKSKLKKQSKIARSRTYIRVRTREPPKTAKSTALQIVLQMMLLTRVFAGYHVLYDSLNRVQYRLVMTGRQYAVDLCVEQIMSARSHIRQVANI